MKEIRIGILAIVAAVAMTVAGCGGGGGGVGAGGAGTTNPTEVRFENAATLQPLAGGDMSSAVGINNAGVIVGLSGNASQQIRGARWRIDLATDNVTAATELAPLAGNSYSSAYAVNDNGVIVGESGDAADANIVAVYWPSGATASVKLTPLAAGNSAAFGVNSRGQIVGEATSAGGNTVPVYWPGTGSAPVALPLLTGGTGGSAYFVSDDNTIVGESGTTGGAIRAVRWKIDPATGAAGNPTELEPLSGHVKSVAMGVNKDGVIVGESESVSGEIHTVTWKEGSLLGISTGFDVTDLGTSGVSSSAAAINDDNWVVGWANDNTASPRCSLWNAAGSPVATVNANFAGSGRAMAINRNRYVVGVKSDRGFVSVPR